MSDIPTGCAAAASGTFGRPDAPRLRSFPMSHASAPPLESNLPRLFQRANAHHSALRRHIKTAPGLCRGCWIDAHPAGKKEEKPAGIPMRPSWLSKAHGGSSLVAHQAMRQAVPRTGLRRLALPDGLGPSTIGLTGRRSYQLSYRSIEAARKT